MIASSIVAVVGSREYPDLPDVFSYVLSLPLGTTVVSGGARGVDETAESAARARKLAVVSFRPVRRDGRWRIVRLGIAAGTGERSTRLLDGTFRNFPVAAYSRNGLIVAESDRVEAFWDGISPGTRNTIELARAAGKLGEVHRPAEVRG